MGQTQQSHSALNVTDFTSFCAFCLCCSRHAACWKCTSDNKAGKLLRERGLQGAYWGGLPAPQGLGQQQDSKCKQPDEKESSDKSSLVGKTKNASIQRRSVWMSAASAIRTLPLVWQQRERKEKEIKWDVTRGRNKPPAHHGTRLCLSAFQPGEAGAFSDTEQGAAILLHRSSSLVKRDWGSPSLHNQAPWWFSNSAGLMRAVSKVLFTWRLATMRQGYGRQWDTDCFLDTQQEAPTSSIPAFSTVVWGFFYIANLKGLCSRTTCYDRAVFQTHIPCTL